MKMIRFTTLIMLCCLLLHGASFGQKTLFLIQSIDTQNEDISPACQKDFNKINAFFKQLSAKAGMRFQTQRVPFSRQSVFEFFNKFRCGADDAVIFLYSGHGFRKEDDLAQWPFLFYCSASDGQPDLNACGVPLDWIHQALISKKPRLSITIGNSCNNQVGKEGPSKREKELHKKAELPNESSYLKNLELITQYEGHIISSAALPGQFAYTNDEDGSYFINELINVMESGLEHASHPTSWASMLKKARDEVQKKKPEQRPQFLILENQQKQYSEGAGKFANKSSYNVLNVQVPQVGGTNYDAIAVTSFDADDYAAEWEEEYDEEEAEEAVFEDLPILLLYVARLDDGNISKEEQEHVYGYYLQLMDELGYEAEDAIETYHDCEEDFQDAVSDQSLKALVEEVKMDFRKYLDDDDKADILREMAKIPDNPGNKAVQAFIRDLKK